MRLLMEIEMTSIALLLSNVMKHRHVQRHEEIHNHIFLAKKVIQMCRL